MCRIIYLILCVVIINFSNVYASEAEPSNIEDVTGILVKCGEMYGVTHKELQAAFGAKHLKSIHPCVWGCLLRRTGFLDKKGQYVLQPGLTYVRNIVDNDEVYKKLESIAKHCETVKGKVVPVGGEVGCHMGALVVTCFLEQVKIRNKGKH